MKLNFRGKEYEFKIKKYEFKKEYPKIDYMNKTIYGFDTETIEINGKVFPQCFTFSSPDESYLKYIPTETDGLKFFLQDIINRYFELEVENKYIYIYGFNLMFDFSQLIKHNKQLIEICKLGHGIDHDLFLYEIGNKKIYLKKGGLFEGVSPFFSIKIKESKRRFLEIMFRDGFSFFKGSLENVAKQLNLSTLKLERQKDLGKVDYRKMRNCKRKREFEKYAIVDAEITRKVGEKIKELHKNMGLKKIRISPPSFAMGEFYNNQESSGIWNGVNNQSIMQLIIDSYKGGRTGGIVHGEVKNITVIDFVSSYPFSMLYLPSFGDNMSYLDVPETDLEMNQDELMEILNEFHVFINIDGVEKDNKYPSLIKELKGKLTPIYGEFENVTTTGIEAFVGIKSGTLSISKINKMVILIDESDEKPFRHFVDRNFKLKNDSKKGSIMYYTAKLILNSSYGKLIESRRDSYVSSEIGNFMLPYELDKKTEYAKMYFEEYLNQITNNPDNIEDFFFDLAEKVLDIPDIEFDTDLFKTLSLTKLTYGNYVLPAGASLITGIARARLNALQKISKAIYWDTDSVFIQRFNQKKLEKELLKNNLLPDYIKPLKFGSDLGDLEVEIKSANGYLSGVKRYYLVDKCDRIKLAIHGVPNAPRNNRKEILIQLATGLNAKYRGREKPLSIKQTKNELKIGLFVDKDYQSSFYLDSRLNWKKQKNKWKGTIKNFKSMEG